MQSGDARGNVRVESHIFDVVMLGARDLFGDSLPLILPSTRISPVTCSDTGCSGVKEVVRKSTRMRLQGALVRVPLARLVGPIPLTWHRTEAGPRKRVIRPTDPNGTGSDCPWRDGPTHRHACKDFLACSFTSVWSDAGTVLIGTHHVHLISFFSLSTLSLTMRWVARAVCCRFSADGVIVLSQINTEYKFEPLRQEACPKTIHEHVGVRHECRLAAALACRLLQAEAVRDPVGAWGNGATFAYEHYSYASVLEQAERSCLVFLPREPITLTLRGTPQRIAKPTAYSSTSYPAIFAPSDDMLSMEPAAPPPEPEFHLDAGDALVVRCDRTEAPGGLGGGSLVYHFVACDASDQLALHRNPMLDLAAALDKRISSESEEGESRWE